MPRRTLQDIKYYPSPNELYDDLMQSPGWPYKRGKEFYLKRDRALFALLYLAELRVSEALRLTKAQFVPMKKEGYIHVRSILLSKRKPGKVKYRDARLPLHGERAIFTKLVTDYLECLQPEDRLFPWSLERRGTRMIGTSRAWQIINALSRGKITQHWLRAFGYNYLYDKWKHDLLAVADSSKTDPRTLAHYIRRRHEKYRAV